jgi:hypothetical protein
MDRTRLIRRVYGETRKRFEMFGEKNWCSYTAFVLEEVGLGQAWRDQSVSNENLVGKLSWRSFLKIKLHEVEERVWKESMLKKTKLVNFLTWKTELSCSNFLHCQGGGWVNLVRLRGGSNCLRLETGRWEKLHRSWRLCESCFIEVEDVEHFILRCPLYAQERKCLIEDVAVKFPSQVREWLDHGNDKLFLSLLLGGEPLAEVVKAVGFFLKRRRSTLKRISGVDNIEW